MSYECAVRKLKPQPFMSIREKTPMDRLVPTIAEYLREVQSHITESGALAAGPPFTRYHGASGDLIDLEAGIPIDVTLAGNGRIRAGTLPGGEAIVTVHVGHYEGLPAAGEALEKWARDNHRRSAGPNWESYVTDPAKEPDHMKWRTEVTKPLEPQPDAGFTLSKIGQIAVTARDLERAIAFYRDQLGMKFLFKVPGMAFFDCDGTRLMVAIPTSPEFEHPSSIIYFRVEDIQAAHAALAYRKVEFRQKPHIVAKLPDRELWMAFLADSEGNILALMSEVRTGS